MAIDTMTDRCVALIGPRGSGKTTVGRTLASLLGGSMIDTDDLIAERAGRIIRDLFQREGEAAFRRHERDAVVEAVRLRPAVLSLGGGAVLDERNVAAVRTIAHIVWLTAPLDELLRRIESDPTTAATRPSLTELSGREELRQLLAEREPYYQRASDLVVETHGRSPAEVAAEIAHHFRLTDGV